MKKITTFLQEEIDHFTWKDFVTIGIVVLLYGILSFYKLGDLKAPNTFYREQVSQEIVFSFEEDIDFDKMLFFNGEENSKFNLYLSDDNEKFIFFKKVEARGTFTWNEVPFKKNTHYIKLVPTEETSLGEVAFYDLKGNYIPYSSYNEYLMDEVDLIPDHLSYMNSSYFDEVYFARTAYEYVQGMRHYEWTHPPLGKLIQAFPIYVFGYFSPFLYRLMGNIAGICMVFVMYFLGGVFFKRRGYALLSALFMAFDTFHFAHTRMGTVDSHLVLFIMCSALFMLLYTKKDNTLYLFLSGIFFGLSICVKWTGLYAGVALAIVYFAYFIMKKKDLMESIVKGSVFFVVIPLVFYCSCYFLFPNNYYYTDTFENLISEQKEMYNYHSNLDAEHFFSSKWYTWPISYKPVWYHQQQLSEVKEETISGVGNLILWIGGIIGVFYCLYLVFLKKDKDACFLLFFFFSLWLPYAFIGRIMFLYHYFPVLPFLFLMVVSLLKGITEKMHWKWVIPVYLFLVILFFILYYPIVSGASISYNWKDKLELFDSWYF